MWVNPPKVEFLRTISKFRKRVGANFVVPFVLPLQKIRYFQVMVV